MIRFASDDPAHGLRAGLNPYGLTYHLGLQGAGGPRANPEGAGLEGFIADRERARRQALEIFDPWLERMSDAELGALRDRLAALGMTPVVSSGLMMGPFDERFALGASARRDDHPLRPDHRALRRPPRARRHAGRSSSRACAPRSPNTVRARSTKARMLAIENHQDFGSDGAGRLLRDARGIGICFDTGNTFPVAEAPLDFTRRVAPHVRHVHLKDYRVAVHRRGLSPRPLRHRRRRGPVASDARHPRASITRS